MQRGQERAQAWQYNRWDELASPGPRISGQNRHSGRRHRSKESRKALRKRERGKSGSGSLDVVDRWIALR